METTQQKIGAPGADFAVPIHVAISVVMRKTASRQFETKGQAGG